MTIISYCYDAFRSSAVVSFAMRGMQAAVAAVIVDVVFNMIKGLIVERNRVGIVVMILALIANTVFKVNILILIVVCGAIGTVNTMSREKARKERVG